MVCIILDDFLFAELVNETGLRTTRKKNIGEVHRVNESNETQFVVYELTLGASGSRCTRKVTGQYVIVSKDGFVGMMYMRL